MGELGAHVALRDRPWSCAQASGPVLGLLAVLAKAAALPGLGPPVRASAQEDGGVFGAQGPVASGDNRVF